jgi:hypothetical protein
VQLASGPGPVEAALDALGHGVWVCKVKPMMACVGLPKLDFQKQEIE